jgi:hypothetical protein
VISSAERETAGTPALAAAVHDKRPSPHPAARSRSAVRAPAFAWATTTAPAARARPRARFTDHRGGAVTTRACMRSAARGITWG